MAVANASTQTGQDLFAAIQKRLNVQGHFPSDREILTLVVDVMNVINTDSANAVSHAATEIGKNPVRQFQRGV